jgi:hypothetical protein
MTKDDVFITNDLIVRTGYYVLITSFDVVLTTDYLVKVTCIY